MPKRKTQILYIHGGDTHKNKKNYLQFLKNRRISLDNKARWNADYLDEKLGKNFHIIRPRMPLQDYAQYNEWEIHFRKFFPQLKDNLILIGQSLGGIFLAKYLSENIFPRKILSTYLVCPPFDDDLPTEDLAGGFRLKSDLSKIEQNSPRLYLLFSRNDDVVPVSQAKKYAAKLKNAKIFIYKNKGGHFRVSTFPEIVKMIKKDVKKWKISK
ncbi:MAG: alpha/beta hydrolase [Patescibacteria group bacterium]|jgi:predicted alpha/beta hydrolase family esterase